MNHLRPYLAVTKALGDEARVRAVMSLADGELCVCELVELLGLSPSTVSKHLSILQQAGLVERRKEGRWRYYRLADPVPAAAAGALGWTREALAGDGTIAADAREIARIRSLDRGELVACYASG